ncbi:hypothetical protein [Streptomyces sp. NPDC058463]|uniref:hypothetical protein n=1 Tax=Streptomyces sp. NPDC058463 TaxID=3346510 RepID=UPI003653FC1C
MVRQADIARAPWPDATEQEHYAELSGAAGAVAGIGIGIGIGIGTSDAPHLPGPCAPIHHE